MKCDDQILYYIENNYKTFDEKINFLIENGLPFHLYPDAENESLKKSILSNRIYELATQKEITKINKLFSQNNISAIFFKGVILSHQLYPKTFMRKVGDIDLFVLEGSFETAANILLTLGYAFAKPEKMLAEHHVVFNNDIFFVELHKSIYHPMIGIDEDFLKLSIDSIEINRERFFTFNVTATLLHLLYHLYMDTYLTVGNLYNIFATKSLLKAGRFIYRAYEIAMFIEKNNDRINWDDVQKDIRKQKFRVFFKKMISDIVEIFPNVFSDNFLQTVFYLEYIDDEGDQLYKCLIDSEIKKSDKDIDYIISNYINDKWETRRKKNICKKVGEIISFTKESSEEKQALNCVIDTEKNTGGLKIVFKVSSDDFCISEIDNYDTQASDGVHLLLCGTEQYSYNSIFFFPKQIDGKSRVVVCDVLNNRNQILTNDLIKAEFSRTENDYTIIATLSNKFLKENNLNSYLYMGLVISDCSSETHRRKNQLILSEEDSQWYNPTYFAKIDME